jgi:two-component system chemotaxis response regulator CheB
VSLGGSFADGLKQKIMPGHDIIVIGASAGGVETLQELARGLPSNLPAAVFIVLHIPPAGPSLLPRILNQSGPLRARHAINGEAIERGRI